MAAQTLNEGPRTQRSGGFRAYGKASGIGYSAGASGAVAQLTDRSTGVTLNSLCGSITTNATSLAAAAEASFVVTNSRVKVNDVVIVAARSGQSAGTSVPHVTAIADGSFTVTLTNLGAGADTGAMIINFAVIKAVVS